MILGSIGKTPERWTNEHAWQEYDEAAMELARKGLKGKIGDPLPNLMSAEAVNLINDDPEAFQERVRLSAYSLAMSEALDYTGVDPMNYS
jgi:hypothetical protein